MKSYRAQLSALRNDFKQWLQANAPGAKVTGEFDIALNARRGRSSTGRRWARCAPRRWSRAASYQGLYTPTADDPDLR